MRMTTIIGMIAALALALAGCSDDNNHDGGHQLEGGHDGGHHDGQLHDGQSHDGGGDLDKEGCEHLQKGPFVDLTAGADAKSAATVKADHKAYRVALSAGKAGFVSFAAADKGDHVFFLDQNTKAEFQDDKGKAITVEKTETSVTACAEVKAKLTVDLAAAGTYYLKLGPVTVDSTVTLVVEQGGHKH